MLLIFSTVFRVSRVSWLTFQSCNPRREHKGFHLHFLDRRHPKGSVQMIHGTHTIPLRPGPRQIIDSEIRNPAKSLLLFKYRLLFFFWLLFIRFIRLDALPTTSFFCLLIKKPASVEDGGREIRILNFAVSVASKQKH